jgi:hypothetical protein
MGSELLALLAPRVFGDLVVLLLPLDCTLKALVVGILALRPTVQPTHDHSL